MPGRNAVLFAIGIFIFGELFGNPARSAEILLHRSATNDGRMIAVLIGQIVEGDARQIRTKIRADSIGGLIVRSPGGLISEAMLIGSIVQQYDLPVQAQIECASACTLVLLASQSRSATLNTRIGFHSARTRSGEAHRATIEIARLYERLGVPLDVVGGMVVSRPDEMYWINRNQMNALGIRMDQSLILSRNHSTSFIGFAFNNFISGIEFFGADMYDLASSILYDLSIFELASAAEREARYKRFGAEQRFLNYNESKIIRFLGYGFAGFGVFWAALGVCSLIVSAFQVAPKECVSVPESEKPKAVQGSGKMATPSTSETLGAGPGKNAPQGNATPAARNQRISQRVEKVCQSCGTILRLPPGRMGAVRCPSCNALEKFKT